MNIAFFGTPNFAVPVLEKLFNSHHKVVLAVTQPDRPIGRKQELSSPPVKEFSQKHQIKILQPEKAKDRNFLDDYKKKPIDINLIVAFGQILPEELIYFPKYHSVNIHASLLPKYRGASPINHAIMAGDRETGITYQFIEKTLDSGDIITSKKIKIEDSDDAITLHDKLSRLASDTVLEVLDMLENGHAKRIKQNEADATYVGVLKKENGKIDFNDSAINIFNKIRGLIPWPAAYCSLDGTTLKFWKSEIYNSVENISACPTGMIVCLVKNKGFVIKTSNGCILITEIQEQSGKKMSAWDYCMGHKGLKGKILC